MDLDPGLVHGFCKGVRTISHIEQDFVNVAVVTDWKCIGPQAGTLLAPPIKQLARITLSFNLTLMLNKCQIILAQSSIAR